MSNINAIPEVKPVVDETMPEQKRTRSKKGHEHRVNAGIYTLLVVMSLIWLIPFVFLVLQSFRSYLPGVDPQAGGMAPYILPKTWSLDSYAFLFEGSDFFPWLGRSLLIAGGCALVQALILAWIRKHQDRQVLPASARLLALLPGVVLVVVCSIALGDLKEAGAADIIKTVLAAIISFGICWIFSRMYLKTDQLYLRNLPGAEKQTTGEKIKSTVALFGEILIVFLLLRAVLVPITPSEYLRWYGNTLIIAIFTAVLQTIIVLSVSYALSRIRFKGRKLMMNIVLVLGMFPGFLTMITLYFLLKQLGLTKDGAVPGLILIYVASSGMGYYISKGFFDTIPKSLDESARIDGATRFQVFKKIIMPLAKPIVIYTVLMAFMAPWGDYVFASLIAFRNKATFNVAVGLYQWINTNDYQGYFTRFCAGGVLVALPITALFLALQKYYVEGVTGGAVKG